MYFDKFPDLYYDYNIKGNVELKIVKDITRNVRVLKEIVSNIEIYDIYYIKDGETPESISEKFYGTPYYNFVLMIFNEKYNYIADFPIDSVSLDNYIADKYGVDHVYDVHHYTNPKGYIVDEFVIDAYPVTNTEHENNVNEAKRPLKLLSVDIMSRLVAQFEELI